MKIITHSGQAHADDIMVVALILVKEGVEPDKATILRVNKCIPKEEKADFIVDIGAEYDPAKGWFDHHQFPAERDPDCALTLVAKHYGMTVEEFPWMRKFAILDHRGPYAWFKEKFSRRAEHHYEVQDALNEKESFFAFLTHIANRHYVNKDSFRDAVALACTWWQMELDYVTRRPEGIAFAREHLEIIPVGVYKMCFFRQIEMRGTGDIANELSFADPSFIITGKLDDRGDGFSAMRLNDSPLVDFSKRAGEKGCVFAHKNGFCLKWENDFEAFVKAVERSINHE